MPFDNSIKEMVEVRRNTLGDIVGGILVGGLLLLLVVSLVAWSWPWHWYDYPNRQVTNLTYVNASGIDTGWRHLVLDTARVAPTNFASPTCPSGNRDLFNPSGSTDGQIQAGWKLTLRIGNRRLAVTLPNSKLERVRVPYPGDQLRVKLNYDKVVMYYDQSWDSLWLDSRARGPKQTVIACMKALSIPQRMLVGLRSATVFVPAGADADTFK